MGYSTDFTLTTLKCLYSLRVYLEQNSMNSLSCGKTSQRGKQGLSLGVEEHRVEGRGFPLLTVSCSKESPLLSVQIKE